MAEGEPKTSRPSSEWFLGLTGGGYEKLVKSKLLNICTFNKT